MPFKRSYKKKFYGKKKSFGKYMGKASVPSYTNRITRGVQRSTIVADQSFIKVKSSFRMRFNDNQADEIYFATVPGNYFGGVTAVSPGNTGIVTSENDYPAGIQNWANFYECYRIMGSKIRCDIVNGTTVLTAGILAVQNDASTNQVPLTAENVFDQPYIKWRILAPTGGQDRATIKHMMKTKKMFGQKVTTDDEYQGDFEYSNTTPYQMTGDIPPERKWDWKIFGVKQPGDSNIVSDIVVTLTYYIRLEARRNQTTFEADD